MTDFWALVDTSGGDGACWPWLGSRYTAGYGQAMHNGCQRLAHRVCWELVTGRRIPPAVQIGHRYRTCPPHCVNPSHLFAGSRSQIQQNRRGAQRNTRSGHRGVHWCKRSQRWLVRVKIDGKTRYGGAYRTIEEAATAAHNLRLALMTHNHTDRAA